MASINDYFYIDDKHNITIQSKCILSWSDGTEMTARMYQHLASGSWYFSVQIPQVENVLAYCLRMISGNLLDAVSAALPKMTVSSSYNATRPSSHPVNFVDAFMSIRMLTSQEEINLIHSEGLKRGLFVEYYGPQWAEERSRMEKPLAFISHDSRDKESIAMPLVLELSKKGIPVWFDEFSLKIGDSLRESIEKGIRETNFCVLVVTKNFLTNDGWTKAKFASVFAREIVQKQKIILPIWHEVSLEEVYDDLPPFITPQLAKLTLVPDEPRVDSC